MKHSKAQGLSLNTIIIAVLVLLVLVILVMIFTGYTGKWGKDFKAAGATCSPPTGRVAEKSVSCDTFLNIDNPAENYVVDDPNRYANVLDNEHCCRLPSCEGTCRTACQSGESESRYGYCSSGVCCG